MIGPAEVEVIEAIGYEKVHLLVLKAKTGYGNVDLVRIATLLFDKGYVLNDEPNVLELTPKGREALVNCRNIDSLLAAKAAELPRFNLSPY